MARVEKGQPERVRDGAVRQKDGASALLEAAAATSTQPRARAKKIKKLTRVREKVQQALPLACARRLQARRGVAHGSSWR